MALTKINNNTLSAVTTLPAAIATGKVLQVLHMSYSTNLSVANDTGNGTASGLTLNITPASTSNKILILPNINSKSPAISRGYGIKILRDSTVIYTTGYPYLDLGGIADVRDRSSWQYLDSPSSTSEITYSINILTESGNAFTIHADGNHSFLTLMEVAG
jgi:hypothetical protein